MDAVEVDRCRECHGLWFDAGEIEALNHAQAAAALDTGDAATGAHHDALRDYPCPRCNGVMERGANSRQPNIRFETCGDCGGTFLDAGELREIAV